MTTTALDSPVAATTVIDRFLEAVVAGRGAEMAELLAPDAVLDATVPDWRFHLRGVEAIVAQYASWFGDPGRFEELDRHPTPDGEYVTYLIAAEDNGVPYAAHHCHRLTVDASGRITSDRFFCGGRWNATRLAEMAEADSRNSG